VRSVSWVLLAALSVLVLLPLAYIALASVRPDAELARTSVWVNFAATFGLSRYMVAITNSVILAVLCPVIGLVLALPIAWLLASSNLPAKKLLFALIFGAFITPGFVNALAWIFLFAPKTGYMNQLWSYLWGGPSVLMNIYTLQGLSFAVMAAIYPIAVVFLYNAFTMLDADLEDSARVAGASPWQVLHTITLPLTRHAIVAAVVIMVLEALVIFAAPAIIGLPANIATITTQLGYLFETYPPGVGRAAALSIPLLAVTAVLLWVQQRLAVRLATTRLTRASKTRVLLGKWRWPALAFVLVVLGVTFILPSAVILATSVSDRWLQGFSLSNLSLRHYVRLFTDRAGVLAITNSLITSAAAAAICVVLGGLTAYISERRITRTAYLLGVLVTVPLAVPSIVYAVGVFAAFAPAPLSLYGTLTILILAYASKFIPFAFMTTRSAISSVPLPLEDSARVAGASRYRVLLDITLPLGRAGVLTGAVLVFVTAMKELPSSILLYTPRTPVIGTTIMDFYANSRWEEIAVLSVVLLAISTVVIVLARRYWGESALAHSN
jgi:iron(III) transport system permease protein